MVYLGGWHAQARIWDTSSIGGQLVAVIVTLLRFTATLINKTQRTLQISSGIRHTATLIDKSTNTIKAKD